MPTLRIQMLGDFRLAYNDTPITRLSSIRLPALLAYLLLHRHAPQTRQHVAFLFWPDSSEAQAQTNLRKLLYLLRQDLPEAERFLLSEGPYVQWRSDAPFSLDVADFEMAMARADQAARAGDQPGQRQALQQAVAVYRGDLLPSCYDDWILPERERLRQVVIGALEQLALLLEGERDYTTAIHYAQRLLQHDPLHEATYRHLMRLHALRGDRAGALRVYHTCATTLERELGVEPNPDTRETYQRLLRTPEAGRVEAGVALAPLSATSPLIGRREEWARLQAAWDIAQQGQPRMVLVSGEAGIGKTRLVEELLAWAGRQGIATASAYCYAAEGSLTYAPVAAWLRVRPLAGLEEIWLSEVARLLPEVLARCPGLPQPGPLSEAWQRQRLFEALARAVLGGGPGQVPAPLLLVIEDLQWCDRDSLEWLRYLLRFDRHAPLLIVGTLRTGEMTVGHPLLTLLNALRPGDQLVEIELGPLDQAETTSLAAQVAGQPLSPDLTGPLYQGSEGNPLFVVEMVRAVLTRSGEWDAGHGQAMQTLPLPVKLQQVIQARLAQLSPPAREMAGLAAVIGRQFTFGVLLRASGHDEEALVRELDELWQRRLVREQGTDAYDFAHNKIRQVAYTGLSDTRRKLWHRRIAQALEALHADQLAPVSGQIAVHYEQARLPERAIPYYWRAAEFAQHMYANDAAIDYYQRLLLLLPEAEQWSAKLELGKLWQLIGQWQKAEAICREALLWSEAHDDLCAQAECRQELANIVRLQGRYDEALLWLDQARLGFEKLDDPHGLIKTLWTMGEVYWYQSDYVQALTALKRQMQIASDSGDSQGMCDATGTMGIVYWSQGDYPRSLACCQQSLQIASQIGHRLAISRAAVTMGNVYSSQGDLPQALSWYHHAFQVASEIGDQQGAGWAIGSIASIYGERGDTAHALACQTHSLQMAINSGDWWTASITLASMAEDYTDEGCFAEAEHMLTEAITLGRALNIPGYLCTYLYDLADLYTRQGRLAQAQPLAAEALELTRQLAGTRVSALDIRLAAQILLIRLGVSLGHIDLASALREVEALLPAWPEQEQQAAIQYAIWQLDRTRETHRRGTAELYRQLYARTPRLEYRQRYAELTGERLPDPPPLPELPELEQCQPVDLAALLTLVDQKITELSQP